MKKITRLAVFLFFAAPGLFAQDFPTAVQEPSLKKEKVSEAEKATEESKKLAAAETVPEVTYEQVLAHPDDIDLNYRYALSQIRKGNLRSASATLERILMVKPDLPKVRLVYAVVLFRLDNLDDAERELSTLQSQKMPESLRAELSDYVRQIRARRRSTHFNTLLGAGFDYDDNRNAAPASGQRLFFDVPITLDSNSTRKGDAGKTMMVGFGLNHDLGYQAGHQLFINYNYYRAEQTNQRILNLQNHAAQAGGVYKTRWLDFTPSFEFDHLLLTQTTYLRSRAGRLHIDGKINPRFVAFLESAYTRQDYNRTLVVASGSDRTGDQYSGSGGASYVLTPTMSLLGSYTHINQGAAAKFDAYTRESFTLDHTWLLGKGQFLLSSVTANLDRYEQPDLTVSKNYRRDTTYRARATYGFPLSFISRSLNDFVLTLTYEYYQAVSKNIPNYSYTNNKASSLLTYKWEI